MPNIRFQSSTSDQFGAPGTYVQQRAVSAPVRGIFLGTTGLVGECVRGPVNKLVFCSTYQRFVEVFGERDYGINGSTLRGQIWWDLQQKRIGKFYAIRAAAAAATKASFNLETIAGGGGIEVLKVEARGVGAHGNDIAINVSAASSANANAFNLTVKLYKLTLVFKDVDISGTNDNTLSVIGSDDATPITLTKIAAGRPFNTVASADGADATAFLKLGTVVASFTSVVGADGSIADTDFTAGSGPMETMNNARGIDFKIVSGRSNSTIKTKIFALAPTSYLSWWGVYPDSATVTDTTWATEVASYRHKAIFPVFNHPYYVDPVTGVEAVGSPVAQLACVLSQTEPDVHPGVVDTAELNQGITRLQFELSDGQRDNLDAVGSTFLNRDIDENNNNVILFGNGRTGDLADNNSQIDGERSKAFLITGLANRMRGDEKRPNTVLSRAKRKGAFEGWLTQLAEQERFVDRDEQLIPQFEVKNNDEVNTPTDRKRGIQRDLVRITLIPKNLFLQLQIEAGTSVTITEV